jgi:BMFP domain-containing protein YqiC
MKDFDARDVSNEPHDKGELVSQQQELISIAHMGFKGSTYERLLREGFETAESLALCSRVRLEQLLGKGMTDEIERRLQHLNMHLALSRQEKFDAIKQMAITTFSTEGPQNAKTYFIEAVTGLLDETGERDLFWNIRGADLLSGSTINQQSFTAAIEMIRSQLFEG